MCVCEVGKYSHPQDVFKRNTFQHLISIYRHMIKKIFFLKIVFQILKLCT